MIMTVLTGLVATVMCRSQKEDGSQSSSQVLRLLKELLLDDQRGKQGEKGGVGGGGE